MLLEKKDIKNNVLGKIEVSPDIFQVQPKECILSRVIRYQLLKRRSGNHQAKIISDVSGTTKKPFKQKGTGKARQGSLRSPQMRGGACVFGPLKRDHAISLPKKIRSLGLRMALSQKVIDKKISIVDSFDIETPKTKNLRSFLSDFNTRSVLILQSSDLSSNFMLSYKSLPSVNVLSIEGLNVYDIMRHDQVLVTEKALESLTQRFKSKS